jgi:hypothetical protein
MFTLFNHRFHTATYPCYENHGVYSSQNTNGISTVPLHHSIFVIRLVYMMGYDSLNTNAIRLHGLQYLNQYH